MNFKNIMRMQKALDASIERNHGVDRTKIVYKKVAALLVELGEFANEYAPFKYWKKSKVVDHANVVEEFVDGIHFFISLSYTAGCADDLTIEPKVISEDMTKQLLATYEAIAKLGTNFNKDDLVHAFELYMGNAELLELSDEEIQEFYDEKNRVNYERIATNY